jgi:hypothetical protein
MGRAGADPDPPSEGGDHASDGDEEEEHATLWNRELMAPEDDMVYENYAEVVELIKGGRAACCAAPAA